MYFVYALTDPRTDIVSYIGITSQLHERLREHIFYKDKNERKRAWIQKLREENLTPVMKILEIVKSKEIARECEAYWIYYYLERGVYLTQPVEKLFCRAL